MAKQLKRNVNVEGKWYGPAYPENKPTAEVLKTLDGNSLAFEDTAPADAAGTAFGPRVVGAGEAEAGAPLAGSPDEEDQLEKMTKDDLVALAEARQVDVAKSASKGEIIDALTGKV